MKAIIQWLISRVMDLNINFLNTHSKTMKIEPTDFNWTPIVSVFTIVSGILAAFWKWIDFYAKEKANQRETMMKMFINETIEPKLMETEKQFERLWLEIDGMRKKMDEDFKEIQRTLLKIVQK